MAENKKYKIAVMSDTHGKVKAIEDVLDKINECDCFVFLGDGNRDIDKLSDRITANIVRVAGNCDLMPELPTETVFEAGNTKFFVTHGHRYGAKSGLLRLTLRARELGCSFVLYGHTHVAKVTTDGDVTLVNPGTLAGGYGRTMALIEGDGDFFNPEIVALR